ncbi:MAG: multidrug ABC transporter, partial [Cyanobacteriota bacterium]|nr:multidrug ABC transporter [Cyanobacteriota bacterium]
MNASREALLAAQSVERELLFSQPADPHQDPELRLLGFCLRQLGERQLPLAPLPGASMAELLDHNDIHHRRIDAPRDVAGQEWPLLVVFEAEGGRPLALYRQGGRNWCYCPSRQRHWPATPQLALAQEAYEIYRSLPAIVPGTLSLLGFTFGTESTELLAL